MQQLPPSARDCGDRVLGRIDPPHSNCNAPAPRLHHKGRRCAVGEPGIHDQEIEPQHCGGAGEGEQPLGPANFPACGMCLPLAQRRQSAGKNMQADPREELYGRPRRKLQWDRRVYISFLLPSPPRTLGPERFIVVPVAHILPAALLGAHLPRRTPRISIPTLHVIDPQGCGMHIPPLPGPGCASHPWLPHGVLSPSLARRPQQTQRQGSVCRQSLCGVAPCLRAC